jgi:hypothetical protein
MIIFHLKTSDFRLIIKMENEKYINLTEKVKVINPCYDSDVSSFYGEVYNYNFERHKTTFDKLSEILSNFNISFSTIWAGKFTNNNDKIYTRFLVKSECNRVFWRKYCTKNPGSGQNYLYINGNKLSTMNVLRNPSEINHYFLE